MNKIINNRTTNNLIPKGDSSAYLKLYDNYAPLLYGIIYRIVKNKAKAEKILEKTILRIWESRTSHEPDNKSFIIWMINIARGFAKPDPENKEAESNISVSGSGILELVLTKGLNIKQAASCLRISIKMALRKLREELKLQ